MSVIRWFYLLPRNLMVCVVRIYRWLLSPIMPPCCRFQPSCSEYGLEALKVHGFVKGVALIAWRLMRCQPFYRGDLYDPVPPRGKWRYRSEASDADSARARE